MARRHPFCLAYAAGTDLRSSLPRDIPVIRSNSFDQRRLFEIRRVFGSLRINFANFPPLSKMPI
jgi:hypothetical protein